MKAPIFTETFTNALAPYRNLRPLMGIANICLNEINKWLLECNTKAIHKLLTKQNVWELPNLYYLIAVAYAIRIIVPYRKATLEGLN